MIVSNPQAEQTLRTPRARLQPYELQQAQQWWETAAQYGERFFFATTCFTSAMPHQALEVLLNELQEVRDHYERLAYPSCVGIARWHLASAMDHLLDSFTRVLQDDAVVARLYLRAGQAELQALGEELTRLQIEQ